MVVVGRYAVIKHTVKPNFIKLSWLNIHLFASHQITPKKVNICLDFFSSFLFEVVRLCMLVCVLLIIKGKYECNIDYRHYKKKMYKSYQ